MSASPTPPRAHGPVARLVLGNGKLLQDAGADGDLRRHDLIPWYLQLPSNEQLCSISPISVVSMQGTSRALVSKL